MPVVWLSLDNADHTRERFLSYLIHALQQISPQTGQTVLAMLHSGQAVAEEAIIFSLLNDLSEIPHDFAIILDDYHTVEGSEVNTVIQSLLEHRPTDELAQYRTPIPGLYLCGASQHPHGYITFGPGYNALSVIAEDLGLDKWWDRV